MTPGLMQPLRMWGGFECSVTRLHGTWRDQVDETGHDRRPEDIDRAAALGITGLRYPFLWERVLRDQTPDGRWPWHDARMARLRDLDMTVVAGLLHHGSGPEGTDLLDPKLPERLAGHAARVAERYPDIALWTPVNEPLTTARFSTLYGVWYPHLSSQAAFLRATFMQCRAVQMSMRAIRARIPAAQLVQTEDIGLTLATKPLRGQAEWENARRYLSLDLLCGWVDRTHPWRGLFQAAGIPAGWLDEMATGEARPDIIGANYYVTSERFLDHRTALYPPHLRGGNGTLSYADTEAVRVPAARGKTGWLIRLRELWARYRIPVIVSEAHLGCCEEIEQSRWLLQAWNAAIALRGEGADIRAVTAWALAGSLDWDSLMQERRRRLELGAWDTEAEPPRPRALAGVIAALAAGKACGDPQLAEPGWWEREERFDVARQRA